MAAFAGAGLMAELLPFSLSQQEVWLDQRTWPDSTHLNIGGAGFIDGKFDLGVFRQAFLKLIEECEALRLVPRLEEGGQWLFLLTPRICRWSRCRRATIRGRRCRCGGRRG